jgi:hypothetical protein
MADETQSNTETNTLAEHGDSRIEAQREKYGNLADLKVEDLQKRAQEQCVHSPSDMNKDELLEALTGGGGGNGGGNG